MRIRAALVAATIASLLLCFPAPARAAEPAIVVEGDGAGHGVGMPQDGALAMGRAGAETRQILDRFYPGTGVGRRSGPVGVRVIEGGDTEVTVVFPDGGAIRARSGLPQPAGLPIQIAAGGSAVLMRAAGGLVVRARVPISPIAAVEPATPSTSSTISTTSTTASTTTPPRAVTAPTKLSVPETAPPRTAAPSAPPAITPSLEQEAWAPEGVRLQPRDGSTTAVPARGREYRGVIDVDPSTQGGLTLVNRLDVEQYLKGMGEVLDPSWPPAALRAQTIAARTYALRAVASGGVLCDDDRCQVYLGAAAEYDVMAKAVNDTAGQVLTYRGALASTVYSASAGGITATPAEGFGTDDAAHPYLVATPYEAAQPVHWSMAFSPDDVGRRLRYPGTVGRVEISRAGPSGRALEVSVTGDAGAVTVPATRFVTGLGLPSSLFHVGVADAEITAPPSPAPPVQYAPDDVATITPTPIAIAARPPRPTPPPSNAVHAVLSELALALAGALAVVDRRRRRARLGAIPIS